MPKSTNRLPGLAASAVAVLATSLAAVPAATAAQGSAQTAAPNATGRNADVDLFYKVYIGGFHVVDMTVDIGLDPRTYEVQADIRSIGMIGRMFPWSMRAHSQGLFADNRVRPVSAGQSNNWRGKERFIDLSFPDGIARVDRIRPTADHDDRNKVPRDMRAGALDLTSAIMAVITRIDGPADCRGKVPVFDGRRRYDLMMAPDGVGELRPNRYSPYAGATTNCILWIDKKAGFKERDSSGWNDSDRRARVWLGRAFGGTPPVPVRLTFETPFGELIAHLNKATLVKGAYRQSLSQAD